jgi:uncharacterized SAM-dependent methyltransferase
MFPTLTSQSQNPSPSDHAIIIPGSREVCGLLLPAGEKRIDTSFVYEVEEAMLTLEESQYFINRVGSRDIKDRIMPSGAELFARIEQHPDYYVGSSEEKLLSQLPLNLLSNDSIVTELGPGDGKKAQILFSRNHHLTGIRYQAIDTSQDFLDMTGQKLAAYSDIALRMHCGDFFTAPKAFDRADTVLFLGTTISNFDRETSEKLLALIKSDYLREGGVLVLGQDSNHDQARLQRCYNDGDKHTATFVLNALRAIKRLSLPSLDLNNFEYHAFFDKAHETMRMGIRVKRDSTIQSEFGPISFEEGELISVGQSRKYSIDSIKQMAKGAGFNSIHTLSAETGVNIHTIR